MPMRENREGAGGGWQSHQGTVRRREGRKEQWEETRVILRSA